MSSNWIQLASGNGYDFETNEIFGDFDLRRDVVRPLTQARFVRHSDRNWPVAVHSVAVARTIEAIMAPSRGGATEAAAAGLMHDCHEAVIGDIPTPVALFVDYKKINALKNNIDAAIFKRLQLPLKLMPNGMWRDAIKTADVAALEVERQLFMAPAPRAWGLPDVPHEWLNEMYNQVKTLLDTLADSAGEIADWKAEEVFLTEYTRLVAPFKGTGVNA